MLVLNGPRPVIARRPRAMLNVRSRLYASTQKCKMSAVSHVIPEPRLWPSCILILERCTEVGGLVGSSGLNTVFTD